MSEEWIESNDFHMKFLDKHKSKFNENFTDNKKLLDELTIIRSKGLKNEIAGYITKFIKNENYEQELSQAKEETPVEESAPVEETVEAEPTPESEETVIEVGAETADAPEATEASEEKTE